MPAAARRRAAVAWSSGKDAAFALHAVRQEGVLDVEVLLTTVTEPYDRVSMHGVRRSILRAQAAAAGLDLLEVEIPAPCPNAVYEAKMGAALDALRGRGIFDVVFGDLFLEDVRAYRERQLSGTGVTPHFPLWGRDTAQLAREMIAAGFSAYVVTVDPKVVPRALAGRRFDAALLAELPAGVDPCGERGEFHTCVVDGPVFARPVPVRPGPVVERDGFVFADLELEGVAPA